LPSDRSPIRKLGQRRLPFDGHTPSDLHGRRLAGTVVQPSDPPLAVRQPIREDHEGRATADYPITRSASHGGKSAARVREVSLRTLAAVLGHADASFTLRTYVHSSDDATRTATAVLARLFETRAGSPC
jgi:integrase